MGLTLRPKIIEVYRDERHMEVWRIGPGNAKIERRYRIAIGGVGFETPAGRYFIDKKFRDPPWLAPKSDWVPKEMRGKLYPYGDPVNPFVSVFLRLSGLDGIGFHGTRNVDSIGTAASHGCIRLNPNDALDLRRRVAVGTYVRIF